MPQSRPDRRQTGGSKKKKTRSGGGKRPEPRTAFQHLTQLVKWVDLVIEVLDARLPVSTRHPQSDSIFGSCPRMLVMTKQDLADPKQAAVLRDRLEKSTGLPCMSLSLKRSSGKAELLDIAVEATRPKLESLIAKGIRPRPMRVCVVGLPNVGKSSLINWLIGRKKTKTGDRPGITQGTQWVRVHPQLELLDTPGILPPIAFTPIVQTKLAMMNLLPERNYDTATTANNALLILRERYGDLLENYTAGLSQPDKDLTHFAQSRNLITSGANPDIQRAAQVFLSDLRDGRVGRVTLDE